MSEWKARRFWDSASVTEAGGGYAVRLDARPVRTPSKAELVVPSRAMAEAIAAEWRAQEDIVDPLSMPVTRAANAAIDKVARQHAEVAGMLAAYGDADLTCYRAEGPEGLVQRQARAWDPLLDWAADTLGARLIPVEGVIHVPQPAQSLDRLARPIHAMTAFELTGFHDLVSLSGSLIIAFAAIHDVLPAEELWVRSRIDETWQEEQWGTDAEAAAAAANKEQAFRQAHAFFRMSRIIT
ncbi:MAG: ATP12 family protein [Rhodobacter sp.]|nr:ATP12 family protein [Rhodobacter sp.]